VTFAKPVRHPWFAKTQFHCIRSSAILTIAVRTQYWKSLTGQTVQQTSQVVHQQLPNSMMSLVGKIMADHLDFDKDSVVNIRCNSQFGVAAVGLAFICTKPGASSGHHHVLGRDTSKLYRVSTTQETIKLSLTELL
jgi:hypothetical protein